MRFPRVWYIMALALLLVPPGQSRAQTDFTPGNLLVVGHINRCTSGPTGTTGNAYVCTLDPRLATLTTQACYGFVADVANTGPATVNYQALGAKAIVKTQGGITTPLVANDIRAGMLVHTCYDGTNMQCQNCTGNAAGGGTPGGTAGQVQWNSAGAFAGSSGQTLDATTVTGWKQRVTSISANATMGLADGPVIGCTSGPSTVTATLPPAASTTQGHWRLVKVDAGVGNCQLAPNGTDLLNGVISAKSAATQWSYVEADVLPPSGWSVTSGTTGQPLTLVASGTLALATTAIASGTCTAAQTATATGTLTTDTVLAGFQGDPTAITGYIPSTNGMLTVIPYPGSGTISFKVCNNTLSSVTPGALSLNWRVVR